MLQSRQSLLILVVAALATVAALPFLFGAENPDLKLRRRQIAAMPLAERERLERHYTQYTAMDASSRQQLQDFSSALDADRLTNRGRVAETLRVYDQWLQTITPHQRDALQKESDDVKRIAMIRKLVEEQREDRIEIRMGPYEDRLGPIPMLSDADLNAVLEVLHGRAELFPQVSKEIAEYEGIRRSLKMFEVLARSGKTVRDLVRDSNVQPLIDVISDEEARRQIETIPEIERPGGDSMLRRMKVGLTILKAIEGELDREFRRRRISAANLTAYFEKLPQDEQNELIALTPEQFQQELRSRFVHTDWSKNRIDMMQVRRFFAMRRPGEERPVGDRPGGFRPTLDGPPLGERTPRDTDRRRGERPDPPP